MAHKTEIFTNGNIKSIEIKKHGRKAKNISKLGLSYIANVLLNFKNQTDIDVFTVLSCTE
ncbi:MAG: hypothetical protein PHE33_11425 [Bacteroidales bacterium]|nr:hypothetical protein [Bacteroidales bacterium]